MSLIKFNKTYAIYAILLFTIEAWIAVVFKSGFIRHTFGDFLVVILLYCAFKSIFNLKPKYMVAIVITIAFGIEFLQLANLLAFLNLEDNYWAKLILGSTFHISDLIAYTLGCITILITEYKNTK
ncbi:DUF2809 domain-containing protein [Ichthyenterobacterium sp. W332]|uniref:DUF2809 domain-containing protein n=1 Tax=Microcosmobacter mediterraneus TaxID=3075607 RepID=A0ABU2YPM9_9FLAO|nr:DUF2809 domain-containing protein [Ichthyenterobacterium sp. W332]MDT0559210.1 DUF2809 domain-containing protein [Ichthyenterobacterium sp. W332]